MARFDVVYGPQSDEAVMYIEPHFCREWDDEGGCYGTREDHGYSFEDACNQVAEWHEEQAKLWREGKHPTAKYYCAAQ